MENEDFSNDDSFNRFKDMINRMFGHQFDSIFNQFNDPEIIRKLQEEGHVDFGFSLATDENGNVNIKSFNPGFSDSMFPNHINSATMPDDEPFFDVLEDGDSIIINGDVTGFSKENIHIGSKGSTKLIIKGESESKSFNKEVDLPEFNIKSVKAKLHNGTLEITLKTVHEDELDGHKITIE